jgi:hypothetical protein
MMGTKKMDDMGDKAHEGAQCRLYLWGRNWCLIEEIEGMNRKIYSKAGTQAAGAASNQQSADAASDSTSITAEKLTSLLDNVDE